MKAGHRACDAQALGESVMATHLYQSHDAGKTFRVIILSTVEFCYA